jgi:hypothetical protein
LLVGRIVSADLFEPKYATIIQNKDELKIPLLLETIPTPKVRFYFMYNLQIDGGEKERTGKNRNIKENQKRKKKTKILRTT